MAIDNRRRASSVAGVLVVAGGIGAAACGGDAKEEQKTIAAKHQAAVQRYVREDIERHRKGIQTAAERLAPGFVVPDDDLRERQLRIGLKYVQEPPKGVPEFIASPMSFLAAVDIDGTVIARDVKDPKQDKMRGKPYGKRYPLVRGALKAGESGQGMAEFGQGVTQWCMLFVHPVTVEAKRVGAVVAGIPLERWAQRLTRQLQADHASHAGLVLWVYVYREDRLFRLGTPELLDPLVPDHVARRAGLKAHPTGYTGEFQLKTRWYGYGVTPLDSIGKNVGAVIVRSNPP